MVTLSSKSSQLETIQQNTSRPDSSRSIRFGSSCKPNYVIEDTAGDETHRKEFWIECKAAEEQPAPARPCRSLLYISQLQLYYYVGDFLLSISSLVVKNWNRSYFLIWNILYTTRGDALFISIILVVLLRSGGTCLFLLWSHG